jgi:hypothetical protein
VRPLPPHRGSDGPQHGGQAVPGLRQVEVKVISFGVREPHLKVSRENSKIRSKQNKLGPWSSDSSVVAHLRLAVGCKNSPTYKKHEYLMTHRAVQGQNFTTIFDVTQGSPGSVLCDSTYQHQGSPGSVVNDSTVNPGAGRQPPSPWFQMFNCPISPVMLPLPQQQSS